VISQTDWNTLPPSILRSYRNAYHLPTATAYINPHAELIYKSSRTALRAPSSVLARRRLRDLKHQRQKAAAATNGSSHASTNGKLKSKGKDKHKEQDPDADPQPDTNFLKPPSPNPNPHSGPSRSLDGTSDASPPTSQLHLLSNNAIQPEYIGRQTPVSLATAVRKHFNAQQLSEAETVARFAYVVRQTRNRESTRTEGSEGDGHGFWMGSHGREFRKGEGGEVGFRLRFRP
jgi:Sin3 binding region of histone deacetylase complex subunit SAP30